MTYNHGELVLVLKSLFLHPGKKCSITFVKSLEKLWFSRPDETKKEDFKTSIVMGTEEKARVQQHSRLLGLV